MQDFILESIENVLVIIFSTEQATNLYALLSFTNKNFLCGQRSPILIAITFVYIIKVLCVLLFLRLKKNTSDFRNLTDLCTITQDLKIMNIAIRYVLYHLRCTE